MSSHWVEGRVLAGFMDRPHVERVAGEWLATLNSDEKAQFWTQWETAVSTAKSLPGLQTSAALVGNPISEFQALHDELLKREEVSKLFAGAGTTTVRLVDLQNLVAIQPSVQAVLEAVPKDDHALADYCLPTPKSVPCEVNVSFTPPIGQVMFLADVPYLNQVNMDVRDGRLTISPGVHINFLQVVDFQGRAYLTNGYHRAFSLLSAGKNVVPAWVVSGGPPVLNGPEFFNLGYLMSLKRPPLLQDYLGPIAIGYRRRTRRYGLLMRFEMAPFNVPM